MFFKNYFFKTLNLYNILQFFLLYRLYKGDLLNMQVRLKNNNSCRGRLQLVVYHFEASCVDF